MQILPCCQEARLPPEDVAGQIEVDPAPFHNADGNRISRTAIVKLSDRVQVEWLEPVPLADARAGDFVVSHPGSIAAGIITRPNAEPFVAASICAAYEKPHRSTGKMSWNITDSSVHRVISDLSLLIGRQRGHRIIAAGDLTCMVWLWHKRILETAQFDGFQPDGCPWSAQSIPTDGKPTRGQAGYPKIASMSPPTTT